MMKNNPWKELNQNVNLKRCDPSCEFNFFWGVNQVGEYLFLLEHCNFEDWPNKKLSFNEIEIEQYQLQSGYRVLLTLKMLNDWDIFYTLCDDILSLSKEIDDEKVLLTAMHNRLQRWQKMFRKTGKKLLTEQEQQGLMGELFFLKEYLFKHYSTAVALSFWRGPIGDKQDFGMGDISIEVKTKLGTTSSEIHISSIEQLNFQTKSAYLFVSTLNKSEKNSFSLTSLINSIKELIEDYESIELFDSLLLEVGYIDLHEYNERFYAFIKNVFYEVDDNFPRLIFSNTPSGISSIKYTIDLNICNKNIIEDKKFKERIFDV